MKVVLEQYSAEASNQSIQNAWSKLSARLQEEGWEINEGPRQPKVKDSPIVQKAVRIAGEVGLWFYREDMTEAEQIAGYRFIEHADPDHAQAGESGDTRVDDDDDDLNDMFEPREDQDQ